MPSPNPLESQHAALGAKMGTFFDCSLPERYRDASREWRAACESVALFDTNFHATVVLRGPDRVRYLNAVLTNDVKGLADGQGCAALLLNPQGHILAEVRCLALPEQLLVIAHASVRQRTVETLDKYIIMDDVTLDDATDRTGSLALEGPLAPRVMSDICGIALEKMPEHSHFEMSVGKIPARLIRTTYFGAPGGEFLADRSRLPELWEALLSAVNEHGGGPLGYGTLNALRLDAGIPWFGYDFDNKVIPHEAALETSHISYTKGCYTGQEIVERVRSRGQVNRRRTRLQFLGVSVPAPGTPLMAEEGEVGVVTSAALSPVHGRVLGMGYVRREHTTPGDQLHWTGGEVEVL